MVLCQLLHKVGIRKDICHSLSHDLPAGLIVAHARVTGLLILDKVMHIFPTLGKGIENYLSKLIVIDRIPFFNKMRKFVGERTQHSIFGQIICTLDIGKASIQVNVDGAGFAPAVPALCSLELTVRSSLRTVQHDINAGDLCHCAEILICFALGIVKGLFQISDCNAFSLNYALPAASLTGGSSFVLCIQCMGGGIGSSLTSFVCKTSLSLSKITGRFTFHGVGDRNAALTHIIGCLVCLVILGHILSGLISMDHGFRLCTVLCGGTFQGNGLFSLYFLSLRGFLHNL